MRRLLAVLGGIAAAAEWRSTSVHAVSAAVAALIRGKSAFTAAARRLL